MFILFGTRGVKHTISDGTILNNSCPNCDGGNLINKLYRRWFTLFFIPVIPLDVLDRFYECDNCGGAYKESIRSLLSESKKEQEIAHKKSKLLFAKALIATMTHMAIIDGDFAEEEEREIMNAIETFNEAKTELLLIVDTVKKEKNDNNYVFNLLNDARNSLSAEALLNILGQAGVVLLADGKIKKEEELLLQEYLIACGMPKSLYLEIITKLQAKPKK